MKKIVKIGIVAMLGSTLLMASGNQMQIYEIKSGKIDYKMTGSTDMMGMKIKSVGKKRVSFDNYGIQNLTEENRVSKQTMGENSKITKSHTMVYMKDSILYQVDFDSKRIVRMENPMAVMAMLSSSKGGKHSTEDMMKKMGAKKVGSDKVLGYSCDIWDLMGTKQSIYKGIPLKVESNIMGVKSTNVAIKAEFDISLSEDDFKLPDFPVYTIDGEKIDRSKLESMDKNSQREAAQAGEEMATLGASMAAAMQSAGIKKGEKPTKAQEKAMEDAMMASMLPQIKQKILSQEKTMLSAKSCFSGADTLKEANVCSHRMDEMSGEQEEDLDEWSPKTKKEILGFIDQSLRGMECIKKAKTMDAIESCMPEE
ncbi:MAG: hypothetical protein U9R27_12395 [Campylobacterota bacterium]|nr:hypothetical protein [Campylobacterota bacterium]